jgi:hypothetical protein
MQGGNDKRRTGLPASGRLDLNSLLESVDIEQAVPEEEIMRSEQQEQSAQRCDK